MNIESQEIIKNNYVIDFKGLGIQTFEYTAQDLEDIIYKDLYHNYECINYLSILTEIEKVMVATSFKENTTVIIRLYLKLENCQNKKEMIEIIKSYLTKEFIK
jgi:hypothetical protein